MTIPHGLETRVAVMRCGGDGGAAGGGRNKRGTRRRRWRIGKGPGVGGIGE